MKIVNFKNQLFLTITQFISYLIKMLLNCQIRQTLKRKQNLRVSKIHLIKKS